MHVLQERIIGRLKTEFAQAPPDETPADTALRPSCVAWCVCPDGGVGLPPFVFAWRGRGKRMYVCVYVYVYVCVLMCECVPSCPVFFLQMYRYPNDLAWVSTAGRREMRDMPVLNAYRQFIVAEHEMGNINRQEVVSM